MNSSLKLFTQSDILRQISIDYLREVLSHFTDSDPQLSCLNAESPYFCSELAHLFTLPQSLSPRLCQTLVLLETAALPEHHARLVAVAQQRLPDICVTEFHPLALALQLWLACPDDLRQFDGSAARAASSVNVPPGEPSNEHAAPPELAQEARQPGSYRHGAPTELFQIENLNSKFENQEGTTSSVGRTGLVSKIENSVDPLTQESINPTIHYSTLPSFHSVLELLRSLVIRYVILPAHAAEALALWIVHTYAFELRDVTTYLALESPVRRCGKTTLLNILSRLVNRPLVAANVSPSALYRAIEELRPTLMIDEADTFLKPNDELLGILNAGYHRATAYILRVSNEPCSRRRKEADIPNSSFSHPTSTFESSSRPNEAPIDQSKIEIQNSKIDSGPDRVGPDHSPFTNHQSRLARFSCWCPKIIARIGRLPETLADRCIVIRMQRKTPNDQCERFRDFDIVAAREDMVAVRKDLRPIALREQCAQLVQDHREAIASAKPAIPAALNDRAADIWEPLLAIADCAGGDWPARAREAAVALSSDPLDTDFSVRVAPSPNPIGREIKGEGEHCLARVIAVRTPLIIAPTGWSAGRTSTYCDPLRATATKFDPQLWSQLRANSRTGFLLFNRCSSVFIRGWILPLCPLCVSALNFGTGDRLQQSATHRPKPVPFSTHLHQTHTHLHQWLCLP